MKKFMKASIAVGILSMLAATTVSAELYPYTMEKYGQQTYTAYSCVNQTVPVVDGSVTEAEYGKPVAVFNLGDPGCYWSGEEFDDTTLAELVPDDCTLYLTYDNEYLYLGVTCIDTDHYTPGSGTDVWDGDYLEFDILLYQDDFDYSATKIRYALGMDNAGDTYGYYALIPDYAKPNYSLNEVITDPTYNKVTRNGNLTAYEARLSWEELLGSSGAPKETMFYMQFGVGSEEYASQSEYNAYLGVFRCAEPLTDAEKAEVEAEGKGTTSIAYPILKMEGARPVEEAPAPTADGNGTAADPANETEVPAATPAATPVTADAGIAASALLAAIAAGAAFSRKRR